MDARHDKFLSAVRGTLELFCSHPEALEVFLAERKGAIVITARAHFADTEHLIGHDGRTHRALAQVFRLMAWQMQMRTIFAELQDPVTGESENRVMVKRNEAAQRLWFILQKCVRNQTDIDFEFGATVWYRIAAEVPHHVYERIRELVPVLVNQLGGWAVDVQRMEEPESGQPATAAGRFTGEVDA